MLEIKSNEKYKIIKIKYDFVYIFICRLKKENNEDIHVYQHKKAYEMLRKILEKYFGYTNVIIIKDANGKPILANIDEICFSISHKDFYIIIAISNLNVGIDIETYHNNNDNIPKKFFSLNEQSYINTDDNCQERFYEIWTKKEAYIKATNNYNFFSMNKFDTFDKTIINNFFTFKTNEYIFSLYIDKY